MDEAVRLDIDTGIGCCEGRVSALLDGVVKGRGGEERRGEERRGGSG